MTPADRLPVEKGERVLDLCAAPGGKATALAAKLAGEGLLVANDASNSRCRALLHNLELAGAGNIIITNALPYELEERFTAFFDKIMVDAPCSGEGMFRKSPEVMDTWSRERVEFFAKQQRNILKSAIAMLRPGGLLMYSTCTFSPLENEGSISYVLENHPEMEIEDIAGYEGFAPGNPKNGNADEELLKTVRIWPHKMKGEGHFLALLRKKDENTDCWQNKPSHLKKEKKGKRGKRAEKSALNKSCSAEEKRVMESFLLKLKADFEKSRLENRNGKVYFATEFADALPKFRYLRNGLYMGELKKNRFEPSQALALYLSGDGYEDCFSFKDGDERINEYFSGSNILLSEAECELQNGFVLIKYMDYPLGWGKKTGNIIKSRYIRL